MTATPVLYYRVTPPEKPSFFAAITTDEAGKVEVFSTRNGDWELEPVLTMADLIQPVQQFAEWDITSVDAPPDQAPPPQPQEAPQ